MAKEPNWRAVQEQRRRRNAPDPRAFLGLEPTPIDSLGELVEKLSVLSPAQVDALLRTLDRLDKHRAIDPSLLDGRARKAVRLPPFIAETDKHGRPWPKRPYCEIGESVHPEYLIDLISGKKLRMLKRHLSVEYGLTIPQYFAMFNLPKDYPTTAPMFRAKKAAIAVANGFGLKRAPPSRKGARKVAGGVKPATKAKGKGVKS